MSSALSRGASQSLSWVAHRWTWPYYDGKHKHKATNNNAHTQAPGKRKKNKKKRIPHKIKCKYMPACLPVWGRAKKKKTWASF